MELSFFEVVLVLLIAFVVLGPKELVLKSQQAGRLIGRLKTQWENLKIMAEEETRAQAPKELQETFNLNLKETTRPTEPVEPHV